jgi:hypothetical protein
MPRKGHVPKRDPIADPIYSSTLVTKFVNTMMWGGKKSTAQGIFYQAMKNLEEKGGGEEATSGGAQGGSPGALWRRGIVRVSLGHDGALHRV